MGTVAVMAKSDLIAACSFVVQAKAQHAVAADRFPLPAELALVGEIAAHRADQPISHLPICSLGKG